MKKVRIRDIILLQAVVIIYTLNTIVAKLATGAELFSVKFFAFFCAEAAILGVYAICWQQMIKKFDLSVAYANRSMAIMWTCLWAVLFFDQSLSVKKVVGIVLVLVGTLIVNCSTAGKEEEEETKDV